MLEEKSKLKSIVLLVREKQNELSQVLQFSKVLEMENRVTELRSRQKDVHKQLDVLEAIKKKQIDSI